MIAQFGPFKYGALIVLLFIISCATKTSLPDPLQAGWNGQAVCDVLQDDSSMRVLRCTFPPGVGHEKHRHAPHFGYALIGGTFRIIDSEGTREVSFPSGYYFSKNEVTEHEVQNIGDSTAVFLIFEAK
jgi:quercetin dioxygenase-like cupin family protein